MAKEVCNALRYAVVKRCKDYAEEAEAWSSKRVMAARWVLEWREIPEEERKEPGDGPTVYTPSGAAKAKARIVILGCQHPDLGKVHLKTAVPVMHLTTKRLMCQQAALQHWVCEKTDATDAFSRQKEIWRRGRASTT